MDKTSGLPTELLYEVFSHLDLASLASVRLVQHRFKTLTARFFWRDLRASEEALRYFILNPWDCGYVKTLYTNWEIPIEPSLVTGFRRKLLKSAALAAGLPEGSFRHHNIHNRHKVDQVEYIQEAFFIYLLHLLPSVKEIYYNAPSTDRYNFGYEKSSKNFDSLISDILFESAFHCTREIMPKALLSVRLFVYAGRRFPETSCGENTLPLFMLPSIRKIVVRNADFSGRWHISDLHRSSPVKELELQPLGIDEEIISQILSLPKALVSFKIDPCAIEAAVQLSASYVSLVSTIVRVLRELHAHTLEALSFSKECEILSCHHGPILNCIDGVYNFNGFRRLQKLELGVEYLMTPYGRMSSEYRLFEILPVSLVELGIPIDYIQTSDGWSSNFFFEELLMLADNESRVCPNLQRLNVERATVLLLSREKELVIKLTDACRAARIELKFYDERGDRVDLRGECYAKPCWA